MAKMGRPKVDKPADKKVTVRFTEEEHELLIEYTTKHDLTMTQVVKLAVMEKLMADQQ
ncbi:CopG family transcriptional regulator [Oliverpabstia intestinalis]|uniref:CopG family transcriptional regulator n=1 Tax=Oliverpabstia intestinalis TaxID=2606633 RepID=UPI003F8AE64E